MDKTITFPDLIWAGTEHSLALAVQAHAQIMAGAMTVRPKDEEGSPLLTRQGNVGVIEIKGGLTNRDHWSNPYYGMVSYNEIRKALVEAALDDSIQAILMDIDSGGGSVAGVADTGNLISTIASQVKPVYAFSDGAMASAAYWIGSSASAVYSSNTAMVGSIGVIATHMEMSKAYKEMGIGVTVIRAGQYKALANRFEPLSEKAEQQIQDQLNATYKVFVDHVAEARRVSFDVADKKMAQGKEFVGDSALNAGLVDGITTFDGMMSMIESKLLDDQSFASHNSVNPARGPQHMKQALTTAQIAAIAAGAPLVAQAGQQTETQAQASTETQTQTQQSAGTETQTQTETQASTETKPAAGADAVVTFLKEENKTLQAEVVRLNVDLKSSQDRIQTMEASHKPLLEIAAASLSNMRVALSMASVDTSAMTAEQVLAEINTVKPLFQAQFKVGGVAVPAAAKTESEASAADQDPLYQAKLAALNSK